MEDIGDGSHADLKCTVRKATSGKQRASRLACFPNAVGRREGSSAPMVEDRAVKRSMIPNVSWNSHMLAGARPSEVPMNFLKERAKLQSWIV